MNDDDYKYLCGLLLETSGLSLGSSKQYLVTSRLVPLAQSNGLEDVSELVRQLRTGDQLLRTAVTEAMTTNETSFLRDGGPFEALVEVMLPRLIADRSSRRHLRIWSAASSTGQEAYSIAIQIREKFPELDSWRIEIVGTDISTQMVERATEGVYSQFEVQRGLPIQLLVKYFEQVEDGWRINDALRRGISFTQLNLLEDFRRLGPFDVVFCRNVLIYFEQETKADILERIAGVVAPDGYLVLGSAETVLGITEVFERDKSDAPTAIYRPHSSVPARQ